MTLCRHLFCSIREGMFATVTMSQILTFLRKRCGSHPIVRSIDDTKFGRSLDQTWPLVSNHWFLRKRVYDQSHHNTVRKHTQIDVRSITNRTKKEKSPSIVESVDGCTSDTDVNNHDTHFYDMFLSRVAATSIFPKVTTIPWCAIDTTHRMFKWWEKGGVVAFIHEHRRRRTVERLGRCSKSLPASSWYYRSSIRCRMSRIRHSIFWWCERIAILWYRSGRWRFSRERIVH